MCKHDNTFKCKYCNINHDQSLRAGLSLICKDAKNFLRLKDKTISFKEYKAIKEKPKTIINNNKLVRCYVCLEYKNHDSSNFIKHYGKLTNLCKCCKAEKSRDKRSKQIKVIRKTKHQIAIEQGFFNCNYCKRDRDIDLKIDNRRSLCKVCLSYKVHEARYNQLTYSEFEENYFYAANMDADYKDQCFICRKRKASNLKKKNSKRNICKDCYSKSERSIKQTMQKNLTAALRKGGISDHRFKSIFGYSKSDFIQSMKSKLCGNMTTKDLLSKDVHIDHIIPSSLFDLTNQKHFAYCWSLDNLQPMWASENNKKLDYLPNGERVSIIKRKPNSREYLDKILKETYKISI